MQLERESKIRRDSILATHREKRLHNTVRWRCAFWFSSVITNVFIHRIRHCCLLYNTFPVMNYDTARFIDPLGHIAFSPQTNCPKVHFQPGRDYLRGIVLVWIWALLPCSDMPKQTELREKCNKFQNKHSKRGRCGNVLKLC